MPPQTRERERERGENMGPFQRFHSAQSFLLSSAGRRREEAAYRGSARVREITFTFVRSGIFARKEAAAVRHRSRRVMKLFLQEFFSSIDSIFERRFLKSYYFCIGIIQIYQRERIWHATAKAHPILFKCVDQVMIILAQF